MKRGYQVVGRKDRWALAEFLAGEGSALLPFVELLPRTEMAVDELVAAAGRSAIEAVLTLSAEQIAGPKHPGKSAADGSPPRAADQLPEAVNRGEQVAPSSAANDAIGWHGQQRGVVQPAERKLRVSKPRLRRKGKKDGGEVMIPA